MPLTGDPVATLRAEFEREMKLERMDLIAAVLLGEYILAKRLAHKPLFPLPKSEKKPLVKN